MPWVVRTPAGDHTHRDRGHGVEEEWGWGGEGKGEGESEFECDAALSSADGGWYNRLLLIYFQNVRRPRMLPKTTVRCL